MLPPHISTFHSWLHHSCQAQAAGQTASQEGSRVNLHKILGQPPSPSATNSCQEEEEEEEDYRDWEVDPCVPKTSDELLAKLAKLYAGCVKIPGHSVAITAIVQDQRKKKELKEMFHLLGLSLHVEDELKRIGTEAEACRRAQVTEE